MRISDWSSDVCSSDLTDFNADLFADLMRRIDVRHDSACGNIPYQAEFLALATRDFRHPADGANPSFGLPVPVFRSCSSDSRSVIDSCVMDHWHCDLKHERT